MAPVGLLCSLVVLTLFFVHTGCITIDVYRNGEHVKKYEDDTAESQDLAASLPNAPLRGQMYYTAPFRNACESVETANVTSYYNWIALIDNYLDCPEFATWNIYSAGYGMMIAYSSTKDVALLSTPAFPRAIVTRYSFIQFLQDNAIVGHSPNGSDYYIKVTPTNWDFYERLFMIFGGVLLAAVSLSILIFCGSICCRTVVSRWRTRGLSRWRVRQLPKRKYKKGKDVCESCSICLEDFKSGDNLRVLPCDHIFHPSCVDEWLQKWNRTCPLCKSTIERRKRGRAMGVANRTLAGSSSTDQEHARLLSHEDDRESETSGERGAEQGRDVESYGATGHLESPLARPRSQVAGEERRERIQQSVTVTLEVPERSGEGVLGSNLERNEVVVADGGASTAKRPLEEQA
jgi:E3 ubiquitin-protein ligase RNF13